MASVSGDVAGDDRDDFGVGALGSHTDLGVRSATRQCSAASPCRRVIVGNEAPATRLTSATVAAHQVTTTIAFQSSWAFARKESLQFRADSSGRQRLSANIVL